MKIMTMKMKMIIMKSNENNERKPMTIIMK